MTLLWSMKIRHLIFYALYGVIQGYYYASIIGTLKGG
jgi:hypothetical protein